MFNFFKKIVVDTKGAMVLTSMILMAAIVVIVSLSIGVSSINQSEISLYSNLGLRTVINIDGCGEEALIRLSRDADYIGETLTVGNTTCVISVSGSGANRTVSIAGTNGNFVKILEIEANVLPSFEIESWSIN